jgi:hypothetical protein
MSYKYSSIDSYSETMILNYKSAEDKMVGPCKENGSCGNAKKDDGRKTVYRKKERKTSFEMDG